MKRTIGPPYGKVYTVHYAAVVSKHLAKFGASSKHLQQRYVKSP